MTTQTTISISEARKHIFAIAERVQQPNVHYTFTEQGRPKAVLMSAEEFESWAETLEVMKDFPNLTADTQQVLREYKNGDYILLEDLPNALPSRPHKIRSKRTRSHR